MKGYIKKCKATGKHVKRLEEKGYKVKEEEINGQEYYAVTVTGFLTKLPEDVDGLKTAASKKQAIPYSLGRRVWMQMEKIASGASCLVMHTQESVNARSLKAAEKAAKPVF